MKNLSSILNEAQEIRKSHISNSLITPNEELLEIFKASDGKDYGDPIGTVKKWKVGDTYRDFVKQAPNKWEMVKTPEEKEEAELKASKTFANGDLVEFTAPDGMKQIGRVKDASTNQVWVWNDRYKMQLNSSFVKKVTDPDTIKQYEGKFDVGTAVRKEGAVNLAGKNTVIENYLKTAEGRKYLYDILTTGFTTLTPDQYQKLYGGITMDQGMKNVLSQLGYDNDKIEQFFSPTADVIRSQFGATKVSHFLAMAKKKIFGYIETEKPLPPPTVKEPTFEPIPEPEPISEPTPEPIPEPVPTEPTKDVLAPTPSVMFESVINSQYHPSSTKGLAGKSYYILKEGKTIQDFVNEVHDLEIGKKKIDEKVVESTQTTFNKEFIVDRRILFIPKEGENDNVIQSASFGQVLSAHGTYKEADKMILTHIDSIYDSKEDVYFTPEDFVKYLHAEYFGTKFSGRMVKREDKHKLISVQPTGLSPKYPIVDPINDFKTKDMYGTREMIRKPADIDKTVDVGSEEYKNYVKGILEERNDRVRRNAPSKDESGFTITFPSYESAHLFISELSEQISDGKYENTNYYDKNQYFINRTFIKVDELLKKGEAPENATWNGSVPYFKDLIWLFSKNEWSGSSKFDVRQVFSRIPTNDIKKIMDQIRPIFEHKGYY